MNQSTSPAFSQDQTAMAAAQLSRRVASGASNFYWIAGLSVINTVLAITGSDTRFVIGLGITQLVDVIAQLLGEDIPQGRTILTIVAVLIDLFIFGLFALFGYFAGKGHRWAFIVGIILYGLDTLLMLLFQDWLALGFHAFFMFGVFNGLRALGQLQAILVPKATSDFPQNIGV